MDTSNFNSSLFSDLIQISWTICALVFGVQAWLFTKEIEKLDTACFCKHVFLILGFLTNCVAAIYVFKILNYVLDASLVGGNLVSNEMNTMRSVFIYALITSVILTLCSVFNIIKKISSENPS